MWYSFRDPREVDNERDIEHFPNEWRRMREILWEQYESVLEKVNRGAAFSKAQPARHGMRTSMSIETLLIIAATIRGITESWIFVDSFLLHEDIHLHWIFHHSPPSQSQRNARIRLSQSTARWWFDIRARWYSTSIRSVTASWHFPSHFQWWLQWFRSRQRQCMSWSRATSSLDTYWWYSTLR